MPKSSPIWLNMLMKLPRASRSDGGRKVAVAPYQFGMRRLATTAITAAAPVTR